MHAKAIPEVTQAIVDSPDFRNDVEVLSNFPPVDPKVVPLGARVLCQLVTPRKQTKSGIILVDETKETERWNNQVARVIAVGPLAFCNRETAQPWKEGFWCEPGDFVVIPRWGGMRRTVRPKDDPHGEPVYFATVNDHEIIEKIYGNPMELETFILD